MSEQCQDTLRCDPQELRQAMSIHTRKITDSCRDKDCIEDLPVYLTCGSQSLLDSSAGTRVRCAELISTYIDVEPVAFDRNHYCIDITFYYRIIADALVGTARPATLYGLASFTKRAVLCGEDSCAHIYRSETRLCAPDGITRASANRPTAVVEVLDPMVLSSRVREACDCPGKEAGSIQVPDPIRRMFDEELTFCSDRRRLYVTLGQFSVIRMQRRTQLLLPAFEYSIPTKEFTDSMTSSEEADPGEVFNQVEFPVESFFPIKPPEAR